MLDVIILIAMAITAGAFAAGLTAEAGLPLLPVLIATAALFLVMAASYVMLGRSARGPGGTRIEEIEEALEIIDNDLKRIEEVIAAHLENLLKNCKYCHAFLPVDWKINEDTVVQPDNLVVCGQDFGEKYLVITPVLVFEILSASTSHKDRSLKYRLYQDAGVNYYCIVNPESSSAEVFRLVEHRYEESKDFQGNKIIFDLGPCTIAFEFSELFGGEKNKQGKS